MSVPFVPCGTPVALSLSLALTLMLVAGACASSSDSFDTQHDFFHSVVQESDSRRNHFKKVSACTKYVTVST